MATSAVTMSYRALAPMERGLPVSGRWVAATYVNLTGVGTVDLLVVRIPATVLATARRAHCITQYELRMTQAGTFSAGRVHVALLSGRIVQEAGLVVGYHHQGGLFRATPLLVGALGAVRDDGGSFVEGLRDVGWLLVDPDHAASYYSSTKDFIAASVDGWLNGQVYVLASGYYLDVEPGEQTLPDVRLLPG